MTRPSLDALPSELLLLVCSHLEVLDIIRLSLTSSHYSHLTKENPLWRFQCYEYSQAAFLRRRNQLLSQQSPAIQSLAHAITQLPPHASRTNIANPNAQSALLEAHGREARKQKRALANWDPSHPSETVNFYQEFIHRHAPIKLSWLEGMSGTPRDSRGPREATNAGVLYTTQGLAEKVFAPLDDGSIGVWDARPAGTLIPDSLGSRLISKTSAGFFTAPRSGVPNGDSESVSIDSQQQRGFFAVQNDLVQVDLNTLQEISRDTFGWPISAISEAKHPTPLTIGTTYQLHLMDPRDRTRDFLETVPRVDRVEVLQPLTGIENRFNSLQPQYAALAQPGPLSILHLSEDQPWDGNGDIWVAGRFTHLLNYDRRYFPRCRGTIHSGARMSSMIALPFPMKPRSTALLPSQVSKPNPTAGITLVAAGEYKGKGSLELYGLSSEPGFTTFSDFEAGFGNYQFSMTGAGSGGNCAVNRQTASSSKLMSVASHGMKLVYSDGDAKLKWVERDGFTPVREFSIDPAADPAHGDYDIFAANTGRNRGDIVQKIVPTVHRGMLVVSGYVPRLHEDNLFVWTGDGRLGMVGFGRHSAWEASVFEQKAEDAHDEAKMREERQYGLRMREALRWSADEARFMSGLGLPL